MTNKKMLEQLKEIDEKLLTIQSELDDGNNKDIRDILDDCFGFLRKARMELAKVIYKDDVLVRKLEDEGLRATSKNDENGFYHSFSKDGRAYWVTNI